MLQAVSPVSSAAPLVNLQQILLEVVAEKTGYPVEMLALEMDLEADLGVDSIKRVEILSSMRERAPGLPEVDAGAMASLRTLGQIADSLGASGVSGGSSTVSATLAPPAPLPPVDAPRFVVRPVLRPANGLGLPDLGRGELLVAGGPADVAAALVARLAARGLAVRAAAEAGDSWGLIHLGGLEPVAGIAGAMAVQKRVFLDVRRAGGRLQMGGVLVTVQDTGGDLGISGAGERAWLAGIPGLVKTAALEWPKAACKAIDVEVGGRGADAVAAAIEAELFSGGLEIEVGLKADGGRWTLEASEEAVRGTGTRLGPQDVVLASGGARGVTAASLIALAREARCRFVLLGRTPLGEEPPEAAGVGDAAALKRVVMELASRRGERPAPAAVGREVDRLLAAREVRATLQAIAAVGGSARYDAVDVTDAAGLGRLLDEVRAAWGPVTVLVHGAGVLADKKIVDKTPEQFGRVFDTKVGGLAALLDATAGHALHTVSLFSSVAARAGNPGQCDYAMANETLNRVAAELRRRGLRANALGWGPWEAGMVTPALKAHFTGLGVTLLPLDVGARMFADELQRADDAELVLGTAPDARSLQGGSGARHVRAGVRVDHVAQPELDGHRVRGAVVVPVVMAVEWMIRAGQAVRPDLLLAEVRDIAVLRGIRVPEFDGRGLDLIVEAEQLENGKGATVSARLLGADNTPHYRAVLRFESTAPLPEPPPAAVAGESYGERSVYDGEIVFHTGPFQLVRDVQRVGPEGLVAHVDGLRAAGWGGEGWATDPAALDAVLQLGLVWFDHALGGASLPTGLERLRVFAPGPVSGPTRCLLRGRTQGRDAVRYDAWLIDAAGRPLAELRGVQHHRVPTAARPAVAPEA